MPTRKRDLKVCLLCDNSLTIESHDLSIFGSKHKVSIFPSLNCDILLTNQLPEALKGNVAIADFRGVVMIIIQEPNRTIENEYQLLLINASFVKFRYLKEPTGKDALKIVDSEILKHLVRDGKFATSAQLLSKYTRLELLREFLGLSLLLIPFGIIVIYLITKFFVIKCGGSLSFLCWFVYYEPDCQTNTTRELQLFALIYAILNLQFYYRYVLGVLEQIKNEVFYANRGKVIIDNLLKYVMPILVFASAIIIFKALFVFMYSTRIAEDNGFINIERLLDGRLLFLKEGLLIYYFLFIDLCLWLITKNFLSVRMDRLNKFMSQRQLNLVEDARRSFLQSLLWDIVVIVFSVTLLSTIFDTAQSQLGAQLIFLQCIYLFINIRTVFHDFIYR